jgi:predicted negative regulator of RcsB-dependent stress response
MKAEHKPMVEHADHDDPLARVLAFLQENGVAIAIGAVVVALAALLYNVVMWERPLDAAAPLWNDYFLALSDPQSENELENFVDKHQGSTEPPVLWAKLSLAEMKLAEASRAAFDDRKVASESLEQAEQLFSTVEKSAGRQTELRDRARLGLGEVYESQNKPDEAVQQYDAVLKSAADGASKGGGADSPWAKAAARGKQRLSEPENREFLAWFQKQEPVKKAPPGKGGLPFDPHRPPNTPDFSLPDESSGSPITPGFKLPELPSKSPANKGNRTPLESKTEDSGSNPPSDPPASSSEDPVNPPKTDDPASDAPSSDDAGK